MQLRCAAAGSVRPAALLKPSEPRSAVRAIVFPVPNATLDEAARLVRTLRHVRPAQWLGRPLTVVGQAFTRPLLLWVGDGASPPLRTTFANIHPAYTEYLRLDADRADARVRSLTDADSRLATYERSYARRGAAMGEIEPCDRHALEPYPSSVRARNLAIAVRRGRRDLGNDLARAARAVLLQLEWHLLGNHLHENAVGLLCAGLVAEGHEADLWYRVGAQILSREVDEQWLPDGGHFERSATYHGSLVASLLDLFELHRAVGRAFAEPWKQALVRALAWVARVRAPDGTWPLFNDASLDYCPSPDALLDLAAALGIVVPRGARASLDVLPDTGWVIAAVGNAFVVADVAPVGPPVQPGHAHADPLTFELWINGERVVVDAGVRQYVAGAARDWCRSSLAHNSLAIDGLDSAEVWAAFRVGRRPRVTLLNAAPGAAPEWAAEHDGYAHLAGAPRHRRAWRLTESSLAVRDDVLGRGTHLVLATLRIDARAAERNSVRVSSDHAALPELGGAWYPRHGEAHSARCLSFGGTKHLPTRSVLTLTW